MKKIDKPKWLNRDWKMSKIPRVPELRLRYRIFLYVSMFLFAALSLINVALECFSFTVGIVIYVLAAITFFPGMYYLIIDLCFGMKGKVKSTIASNAYASRVSSDYRLRTMTFVVPGAITNVLFAGFNAIIGIMAHSAWFGSLAAYYILLSAMRIAIVREEKSISEMDIESERLRKEIRIYRNNSVVFIFLAIVLGGMVILLENAQGGKEYPGFTIYAAAAYAFYKIIKASIDVIKVRKKKSPLLEITKRIGHIDACVSILTLQTAMLTTFGSEEELFIKIMNGATGAGVSLIILFMGLQGIWIARRMRSGIKVGGKKVD